ncbi:MAG: HlyD family efflux transporter periplasmic adaptor subunit [Calothrix sp. SM1_7_51]|nr:HlyD family efflux transporter periplasmic adaptor subunit [Calothrix sp. SM1_7_51]
MSRIATNFSPPLGAWTTLGGVFLLGIFGTALTLAAVTRYKVVVKADATVRPSGEIRVVQAAMEGTVKGIAVKENQMVKAGDEIATIDSSILQTQKSQIIGTIQQNRLQLVQMNAQVNALDGQIAAENNRSDRAVASARAELNRTQREYQERQVAVNSELQEAQVNINIAQNEFQKAKTELQSAQANVRATEAALKAAISRRDRYQIIAQSGSISQNQLEEAQLAVAQQQQVLLSQKANVESQRQVVERQQQAIKATLARHNRAASTLNPTNAVVAMATEKIAQERATGEVSLARLKQEQKSLLQRKIEIQNQINNSQKELQRLEIEQQKTIVISPESGTILKLELRNPGQVVRPGEPIAQISPVNAPLLIKARVSADDVSKIKVCRDNKVVDCLEGKVLLRVSAYPYPDYGTLKGAVRAVTTDVIAPQNNSNTQVAPYYEVTIESEKIYLQKGERQFPIQPGMEIAADIISKEETVLRFILRKARLLTDF